jgi:hypothetical protein
VHGAEKQPQSFVSHLVAMVTAVMSECAGDISRMSGMRWEC